MRFDELFQHMTYAPGYTSDNYPNGPSNLSMDELINAFENSYLQWILRFADHIIDTNGSGFAVLTLMNAYPEMIAQLHGISGKKPDLFQQGMLMIFPELKANKDEGVICTHLYSYLRNGLAHMSLTGFNIILTESIPNPLTPGEYMGSLAIAINPRAWLNRIKSHFNLYISELRNEENEVLRMKFVKRMSEGL